MRTIFYRITLLLFACNFSFAAFSQNDSVVYFFDKDLNVCEKKKAQYVGIGVKENGLLHFKCYSDKTGYLLIDGWYSDETLASKEGAFTFYDKEGYEESKGVFKNNKEEGYWMYWANGHLSDSILYENGADIEKITYNFHPDGYLETRILSNGPKKIREFTKWNKNGLRNQYFRFVNNLGDWYWYYPDGNLMKMETKTEEGKSQKYYWPDGGEMTEEEGLALEKKIFEKSAFGLGNLKKTAAGLAPEYPGGAVSLNAFIQTKLRALMTRKKNVFGNSSFVSVTFHLDKKGRAENIKVEGADSDLQMYLYRAFQTMPPWKMNGLTEYGPVYYNLSISSTGY